MLARYRLQQCLAGHGWQIWSAGTAQLHQPTEMTQKITFSSAVKRKFSRACTKMLLLQLEGLRRNVMEWEEPTNHLILTFEMQALPSAVKVGLLNCRVHPFILDPRCCFRLQRFGHGSRNCCGKKTCGKCGGTDPVADIYENNLKYANWWSPLCLFSLLPKLGRRHFDTKVKEQAMRRGLSTGGACPPQGSLQVVHS